MTLEEIKKIIQDGEKIDVEFNSGLELEGYRAYIFEI